MNSSARLRALVWVAAGLVCFLALALILFTIVPWITAMSPQEALARWPEGVRPEWRAVIVDHGQPKEWALGTASANPGAFAAACGMAALAGLGWFFCFRQARRASGRK